MPFSGEIFMSKIHLLDAQEYFILETLEDELLRAVHKRNLDLTESLEFEVELNEKAQYIGKKNRVIIEGDEPGTWREFIIDEVKKSRSRNSLEVYCSPSFQDIRTQKDINPITLNAQSLSTAATWVLSGTEWQIGIVDGLEIETITIENYTDPFEVLGTLASTYDKELNFRIEVLDNEVTGRVVDFLSYTGTVTNKEIEHSKDMIDIVRTEKTDEIVTALRVVGPEKQNGTRETILVTNEDARQIWGWGKNKKHRIKVYEPQADESTTLVDLKLMGDKELENRIKANLAYETTALALENMPGYEHESAYLGDGIRVKDIDFSPALYLEARIQEVERDLLNDDDKDLLLGDYIEYSQEDIMKEFLSLKERLWKVIESDTPPPGSFNILWIDTSKSVPIPKRWNGTEWTEDGKSGDKIDGTAFLEDLETSVVAKYSNKDMKFYISHIKQDYLGAVEPDDNNPGQDWYYPLRTVAEAISRIPKNYDGICYLYLPYNGIFSEKIVFENITGNGKIVMVCGDANYHTKITGRIEVRSCTITIDIQDLDLFGTNEIGFLEGVLHSTKSPGKVRIIRSNIRGMASTSFGACSQDNSYVVVQECNINDVNRGVAALEGGKLINKNNTGQPRNSGAYAYNGKVILEGTMPHGQNFTNDIEAGGQIIGEKKTADGDTTPVTPPVSVTNKTGTWIATSGDAWRDTYNGSWLTGEVAQGKWNIWGIYHGIWYSPSALSSTITGKTIVRIRAKIRRLKGSGNTSNVPIFIRPHTYLSRPSGMPQFLNDYYQVNFYVEENKWVTLPTTFHKFFESGQAKGLGVYHGSSSSTYYAKLDKYLEIEITYR
jgi:phage minor structural protein